MATQWRSVSTSEPAWLTSNNRMVCPVAVARTRSARRRGLIGLESIDGALWITKCRCVHTFGMAFPIDVAFIDRANRIVAMQTIGPNRISAFHRSSTAVVESYAGSMRDWGLSIGDLLALAPDQSSPVR